MSLNTELLIWWTSQKECELLVVDDQQWEDYDATIDGVPDYIHKEFCSRLGRAGRGRLWVPAEIDLEEIPQDETKPAYRLAEERGGIVIWAKDGHVVFHRPGFLTDLEWNMLNEVPPNGTQA